MAHLTDRGQLILVAGFALAVVFVALALILNAAIFTGNLATSGENTEGTDALAYRQSVQTDVGEFVAYANDVNRSGYSDLEENVSEAVTDLSRVQARQLVGTGRTANFTVVAHTDGSRIVHNTSGGGSNFDDPGDPPATITSNWTVADGFDNARKFRINVSGTNSLNAPGNEPFRIGVYDSSGDPLLTDPDWWMNVSSPSSGEVQVTVHNGSGSDQTCTRTIGSPASDTEDFWINVTDGTINGTECDAMVFAENVGTIQELRYASGSAITGNYSIIVDTTGPATDTATNYDYYDDDTGVESEKVLYSVTVELVYRTPELFYRTDIRVAPGETDG